MNLIHKSKLDIIFNVLIFLSALLYLFLLYWMFTSAFKTNYALVKIPPEWFPFNPTLDNLKTLFKKNTVFMWAFNSFFISFTTTSLVVLVSSMAAYAFAKLKFLGNRALFYLLLSTLMIPKEILIIPLFRLVNALHLVGTYPGIILPNVASAFGVFLLKQFFETIPDSIREAARIDGCSEWGIFFKIILPIGKPGVAALFILMFVLIWNDYLWQLIMINKDIMKTLQLGVAGMQNQQNVNMALIIAGLAMASIPMIIVFLVFQKYFTRGITIGALKE